MAKVIGNDKGFKVIECSAHEIKMIGGLGICDYCGQPAEHGFYIAVLNQWFCDADYQEWCGHARYYPEDAGVETAHFDDMKLRMRIK